MGSHEVFGRSGGEKIKVYKVERVDLYQFQLPFTPANSHKGVDRPDFSRPSNHC